MLCLWAFIPLRLAPSAVIEYITYFDLVYSLIALFFGITCIIANHGHMYLWFIGGFNIFMFVNMFSLSITTLCGWRSFLKKHQLRCYSLVLVIFRSIWWTSIFLGAVGSANTNYQKMKDSNDLYNEHDNKVIPKTYFVTSKIARGIGSYAEEVTKYSYYTFGSMYMAVFASWMMILSYMMRYAMLKCIVDQEKVKAVVSNKKASKRLIQRMSLGLNGGDDVVHVEVEEAGNKQAEKDVEGINEFPVGADFENKNAQNEDNGNFINKLIIYRLGSATEVTR